MRGLMAWPKFSIGIYREIPEIFIGYVLDYNYHPKYNWPTKKQNF